MLHIIFGEEECYLKVFKVYEVKKIWYFWPSNI